MSQVHRLFVFDVRDMKRDLDIVDPVARPVPPVVVVDDLLGKKATKEPFDNVADIVAEIGVADCVVPPGSGRSIQLERHVIESGDYEHPDMRENDGKYEQFDVNDQPLDRMALESH